VTYEQQGNRIEEHLDEVLGQISEAGYEGVEAMLSQVSSPAKAEVVSALLQKHRLKMVSLYAGGAFHTERKAHDSIAAILDGVPFARALGVPMINTNPDPVGREKTDEELALQAEGLNRLGEALREKGLRFVIHNHDPEIRSKAREFHHNLDHTDVKKVGLCLDTHWALRGGADPLALARQYASRLKSLHLRNSVRGVWSEALGDGEVDHAALAELLRKSGYTGPLIVELAYEQGTKLTRTLAENTRVSREYVRRVFGS
jgi:inosose dehydratase